MAEQSDLGNFGEGRNTSVENVMEEVTPSNRPSDKKAEKRVEKAVEASQKKRGDERETDWRGG